MQVKYNYVVPVKDAFFRNVFTTSYDIAFAPPRTDECYVCASLDVKISAAEGAMKEELEQKKSCTCKKQTLLRIF